MNAYFLAKTCETGLLLRPSLKTIEAEEKQSNTNYEFDLPEDTRADNTRKDKIHITIDTAFFTKNLHNGEELLKLIP